MKEYNVSMLGEYPCILKYIKYVIFVCAFSFNRWIIKTDSETGSQVCFSGSDSSVGSVSGGSNNNNINCNTDGHWLGSGVRGDGDGCDGGTGRPVGKSGGGSSSSELPSIVERNARIIKWLWNCRKANLQQTLLPSTPSST